MLSCLARAWEEDLLCETDSGLVTDLCVPFSAKKNIWYLGILLKTIPRGQFSWDKSNVWWLLQDAIFCEETAWMAQWQLTKTVTACKYSTELNICTNYKCQELMLVYPFQNTVKTKAREVKGNHLKSHTWVCARKLYRFLCFKTKMCSGVTNQKSSVLVLMNVMS